MLNCRLRLRCGGALDGTRYCGGKWSDWGGVGAASFFLGCLVLRPGNSQRRTSSLHPRKIGALTRRELKLLPTPQSLYYDYYLPTIGSVAPTQAELDQLLLDASAYIWVKYCRDGAQVFTYTDFRAAKAILEKHPSNAQAAAKTSARHQFDHFGDWTNEKWLSLLEPFRECLGLIPYPDLPGATPPSVGSREDSFQRLAASVPGAFRTPPGIPEDLLQTTPVPSNFLSKPLSTPSSSTTEALYLPRFRPRPTPPGDRRFTLRQQELYPGISREDWVSRQQDEYEKELRGWTLKKEALKEKLDREA